MPSALRRQRFALHHQASSRFADQLSRRSREYLRPFRAGDDGGEGEADEEAALQRAGDAPYLGFERRRLGDAIAEEAVGGVVSPVGDVRAVQVARLGAFALQAEGRLAA